jgi:hypothetical protein
MPRRFAFTVLLAVALVLTTSPQPEVSQAVRPDLASPKSFSVSQDGRSPVRDVQRGSH